MSDPVRPLIGWLAAFGVVIIWSGWVVVSRLGVINTLTIHDMIALRFSNKWLTTEEFVWHYWPRHLTWWQIILFSCGQGAPYLLLAFAGLKYAPAAHLAIVMNGTLPLFAAVIGWLWLKDKPDRWRIAGMAVILAGCGLIGWDRSTIGVVPGAWIGHLMFMGAALFVAANLVAVKAWRLTALEAMVSIPTLNLLWFGPLYLALLPKALDAAPWREIILQGAYQGLGPSLVAVLLFTTAIRIIGPSPVAAIMAMVPATATLIAIPVLGEWPSVIAWAGLIVTTAGILLAAGWRPAARR